jgi:aminopeptidase N
VGKHGLQNVETTDFKVALEEATGKSLDWFFDEWLYHAGHPEFEVSWSWDEKAKQIEVKVKQTHEVKDLIPLFRMPVELEFATDDRVWRETVQVDRAEHTFRISARERPKTVLFDPDGNLLKKLTFKKDKEELVWQLAHAKGVWARMDACAGLGRFVGDEEAVAVLSKALAKDKFWSVRRAAATALGEVGTTSARDVLLGALKGQDSRVRHGIYGALGKFRKDDAAFQALAKAYLEDGTYAPMARAAQALAETRHAGAFDALVQGMDRPSQAEVVARSAATALAELREEKGIPVLTERTAYGRPELQRSAAATGLGKLGYYLERRQDEILDDLAALTRDPNYRTKLGAVEGLVALGTKKGIPELEKVADTSVLGTLRRNARRGISQIREKHAERAKRLEQQDELDKLKDEGKELKTRLAALEAKVAASSKRKT